MVAGSQAQFREHVVAEDLKGAYQVVAADVNRDGRVDLIGLAQNIGELVWFENPGWQRHVMAQGLAEPINLDLYDPGGKARCPPSCWPRASPWNRPRASESCTCSSPARTPGSRGRSRRSTGCPRRTASGSRTSTARAKKVAVNCAAGEAGAASPDYRDKVAAGVLPSGRVEAGADLGRFRRGAARNRHRGLGRRRPAGDPDRQLPRGSICSSSAGTGAGHARRSATGNPDRAAQGRLQRRGHRGSWARASFVCAIEPWHGNEVVGVPRGRQGVGSDGHRRHAGRRPRASHRRLRRRRPGRDRRRVSGQRRKDLHLLGGGLPTGPSGRAASSTRRCRPPPAPWRT